MKNTRDPCSCDVIAYRMTDGAIIHTACRASYRAMFQENKMPAIEAALYPEHPYIEKSDSRCAQCERPFLTDAQRSRIETRKKHLAGKMSDPAHLNLLFGGSILKPKE